MRTIGVTLVLVLAAFPTIIEGPAPQAHGTVNEIMIGIIFPSSNVVSEAEYQNPDAPSDKSVFDAYGGWLKVQTAAIAMAESTNLLMIPGRMCSNGKPIPADQEDWKHWFEDLKKSALAAYDAAKVKDQGSLIKLSGQLSASCTNCHARYVDVGGDPKNRCVP